MRKSNGSLIMKLERALDALWPWHQKPYQYARNVAERFRDDMVDKYDVGQEEHGGHLPLKPALAHLREEILDAAVYVTVVSDQIHTALRILRDLTDAYDFRPGEAPIISEWRRGVQDAISLLTDGNVAGLSQEEVNWAWDLAGKGTGEDEEAA